MKNVQAAQKEIPNPDEKINPAWSGEIISWFQIPNILGVNTIFVNIATSKINDEIVAEKIWRKSESGMKANSVFPIFGPKISCTVCHFSYPFHFFFLQISQISFSFLCIFRDLWSSVLAKFQKSKNFKNLGAGSEFRKTWARKFSFWFLAEFWKCDFWVRNFSQLFISLDFSTFIFADFWNICENYKFAFSEISHKFL